MFAHSVTEPNSPSPPTIDRTSETRTNGIATRQNERSRPVPQTPSSPGLACFDKVPMALKKVVRLAVSAFYGVEQGIMVDYLIHYPCLREDHLADVLRLERKHVRALMAPLRADHVVKAQMRLVISGNDPPGRSSHAPTPGQQQFYYYYVDYGAAANAIRYRLDRMGEALERSETQASTRSTFRCSDASCGRTYTDLDVDRLFDTATGDLFCTACGCPVVLDGDNADKTHVPEELVHSSGTTKREARKAICQFNDQLEPLFAMLRKVENVVLAPHLAKPEPLELDLDNLSNVKRGVSGGNLNSKIDDMCSGNKLWKNDARSYNGRVEYEWYKTGISINIQSSADTNLATMQNSLMNRSVKNLTATGINLHSSFKALLKKELPSWLSSTSSNILRDYNIKILGLVNYDISMCANDYDQNFNSGRNISTSNTNKRFKTSHVNAEINDKNNESQPVNESTNLISPWGTTSRYRRGGSSGGIINYKEDDNLDETISRTLLIYESKGSNINPKPNQGDITNSTQIVNGISNTDVNKFDEQEIFDRETYGAYNNMGEDKLLDIKHHNYVPDHSSVAGEGYFTELTSPCFVPTIDIGGNKVSLYDIDSSWLAKMTVYEKEIYFKTNKHLFELYFDA